MAKPKSLAALPDSIEVANCAELIDRICSDLGQKHVGCTLSREKLPPVGDAECKTLGPRYGRLVADLQLRADVRKDASPEHMKALMMQGTPPAFGNKDAPVQVVEMMDFECGSCARLAGEIEQLRKKTQPGQPLAGKIRFVARMFPLQEMHPQARLAAQAALAAHQQGKFWDYHDLLFANQSDLSWNSLEAMAKTAKLDMDRFKQDIESKAVLDALAQDHALGLKVTTVATPMVFVNGSRVAPGVVALAIQDALKTATAR